MQDWNIRTRGHECSECQKGFNDKQSYRTLLFHGEEELNRIDLCNDCWKEHYEQDFKNQEGFLSAWQGTYKAPPPPEQDAIHKANAEQLLHRLVELNDPQYLAASYILAVMLERKRIIKVKDQIQEEERRVFIYEHPKNGDVFSIPDPGLKLTELAEVQKQVAELMERGLPGDQPEENELDSEAGPTPDSIPQPETSDAAPESEPEPVGAE